MYVKISTVWTRSGLDPFLWLGYSPLTVKGAAQDPHWWVDEVAGSPDEIVGSSYRCELVIRTLWQDGTTAAQQEVITTVRMCGSQENSKRNARISWTLNRFFCNLIDMYKSNRDLKIILYVFT